MSHRLPQHIVEHIQEAVRAAGLENASFDGVGHKKAITVQASWEGAEPKEYPSVTDFVREKVRLHHSSWVIGPLKEVLTWSESSDDGSQKEYDVLGRLRSKWPNPKVLEEAHKEIVRLRDVEARYDSLKRSLAKAVEE